MNEIFVAFLSRTTNEGFLKIEINLIQFLYYFEQIMLISKSNFTYVHDTVVACHCFVWTCLFAFWPCMFVLNILLTVHLHSDIADQIYSIIVY